MLVRDSPPSGSWQPSSQEGSPAAWGPGTGDNHPSGTAATSYRSGLQSSPWHWQGHKSYGRSEGEHRERGEDSCDGRKLKNMIGGEGPKLFKMHF